MPKLEVVSQQQLFIEDVDRQTDERLVEEMFFSMVARHPYYQLDQTAAKNIYGEPSGEPSYTRIRPLLPIHVKLDPEKAELDKYGYDRDREVLFFFCNKILRDRELKPKVGDRIDFLFTDVNGVTTVEHLIINQCSAEDFSRQQKVPYQMVAAGNRTHKQRIAG